VPPRRPAEPVVVATVQSFDRQKGYGFVSLSDGRDAYQRAPRSCFVQDVVHSEHFRVVTPPLDPNPASRFT
jgi:hypothetical protein